jgi:hypothetical protein
MKKRLDSSLRCLVHRAGHVHQAEHHRLAGGHRRLDPAAKTQVDRVQEGDGADAPAQLGDAGLDLVDLPAHRVIDAGLRRLQQGQALLQFVQLAPLLGAQGNAPAQGAAHRAHHMQVVGRAVAGEAGAVALPLRGLGQLGADQVRQGQVLEEDLHELLLAQAEDEIVLPFAGVAGLAAAGATAPLTPLRALDAVTGHVLLVAGVHHLAFAAGAVVEHRLAHILLGDVHVLAALQVADAAPIDRPAHRFLDLLLVAAQETFTVADRLVLAGKPAIDDLLHDSPWTLDAVCAVDSARICEPADTTRRAGAPASTCSPC